MYAHCILYLWKPEWRWIPLNLSYELLWATVWMLGTKNWSTAPVTKNSVKQTFSVGQCYYLATADAQLPQCSVRFSYYEIVNWFYANSIELVNLNCFWKLQIFPLNTTQVWWWYYLLTGMVVILLWNTSPGIVLAIGHLQLVTFYLFNFSRSGLASNMAQWVKIVATQMYWPKST